MVRRVIGLALLLAAVIAAAAPPASGHSQDLLLETELEPAQVYVQAQAIYRLRFYQAIDVRELKISGPSARLADLRPLGPDRVYEAQRDGRRYRVHERSYAVFPFSSGSLELSGAHALGRVTVATAKSAEGRQAVRVDAATRTLTVYPAPAAAGLAPWLPARSLSVTENWLPAPATVRPGQVQRRNIRIEAAGIDAGQIPPLQITAPGMLVDAEPPRFENRAVGELNIGIREQSFRMVALRAGNLLVPELTVHWWNSNAGVLASATLPARMLRVVAADPVRASALPTTPTPAQLLLTAGVLLLCISMALAYIRHPIVRAVWHLQHACRLGKADAVRDALLQWAAAIWPVMPPLTLASLAERFPDPTARHALYTIERSLYGPAHRSLDAAALGIAVRTLKRDSWQWALLVGVCSSDNRSNNFTCHYIRCLLLPIKLLFSDKLL